MIRVIIINPQGKTVTERELLPSHDSQATNIRNIIGGHFDIASIIRGPAHAWEDVVYVDDEGLYKPELEFFALRGVRHQPFAGIGVITGSDGRGETVSATSTLADIKRRVVFMTRLQVAEFFGGGAETSRDTH